MRRVPYRTNCVGWPRSRVEELTTLIDRSIEITWETFRKRVDPCHLAGLSESLGYQRGDKLQLHNDYAVRFCRSRYKNRWVYYFVHSAIEYFFW